MLIEKGFDLLYVSHAEAILAQDFPQAMAELDAALSNLELPITEIIGSGGGETKFTQRLRRVLAKRLARQQRIGRQVLGQRAGHDKAIGWHASRGWRPVNYKPTRVRCSCRYAVEGACFKGGRNGPVQMSAQVRIATLAIAARHITASSSDSAK